MGMVPPLVIALLVSENPLVFVEPGIATAVVDGAVEVGEPMIVVVGGFELGGVELVPGTVDAVESFRADGIDEPVITVEEVFGALTGPGLGRGGFGRGAGRAGPFGRGAFRATAVVAARALPAMGPVAPVTMLARATAAANHRGVGRFTQFCSFTGGEDGKFCSWVMPSRYGLVLKSYWEPENSFHTDPQRFLRLGS